MIRKLVILEYIKDMFDSARDSCVIFPNQKRSRDVHPPCEIMVYGENMLHPGLNYKCKPGQNKMRALPPFSCYRTL